MVLYSQYPDQSGVHAVILFTEPHPVLSLTIHPDLAGEGDVSMFRFENSNIQTRRNELDGGRE